jgi:hypothetical protein
MKPNEKTNKKQITNKLILNILLELPYSICKKETAIKKQQLPTSIGGHRYRR